MMVIRPPLNSSLPVKEKPALGAKTSTDLALLSVSVTISSTVDRGGGVAGGKCV